MRSSRFDRVIKRSPSVEPYEVIRDSLASLHCFKIATCIFAVMQSSTSSLSS